ncbi:MAG: TolC family protein [Neisseria sp.]|nr:TolC family protein [Neisseria sp.]
MKKNGLYQSYFQAACVVMAGIALTACATTTPEAAKSLQQAGLWTDAERAARYDIDEAWWFIYQDKQLNQLIETALANNTDLKKTVISLTRSAYALQEARQSLFPELRGDASISDGISKNLKSGEAHTRTASSSLNLGVSYEVDLWQKVRAGSDAAAWDYAANEQDVQAARLALIHQVIDSYFHLAYAEAVLPLNQEVLVRQQELARIAAAQYRHGKISVIDEVNARQSLLAVQDTIHSLTASRDTLKQNLRNLLNLRPGEDPTLQAIDLNQIASSDIDLDVPLAVLANRPDIRASEYRLQQAFASQRVARRSWLPTLSLRAAINATSERAGSYFSLPLGVVNATVGLPFLDWKSLYWQNKRAEADFQAALVDFEKTLTTALNEVDGYDRQYRTAQATLNNAERKYGYDRENTRYHDARYRHGAAPLSDLLSAQNGELASAQAVLNARYHLLQSENLIYRAMAGRYRVKSTQNPSSP